MSPVRPCFIEYRNRHTETGRGFRRLTFCRDIPIRKVKADSASNERNVICTFRPPAFASCRLDEENITPAALPHCEGMPHDRYHAGDVLAFELSGTAVWRISVSSTAKGRQASRPILRQRVIFCGVIVFTFGVVIVCKQVEENGQTLRLYPTRSRPASATDRQPLSVCVTCDYEVLQVPCNMD